jgi:hypothetical protein
MIIEEGSSGSNGSGVQFGVRSKAQVGSGDPAGAFLEKGASMRGSERSRREKSF